MRFIFCADPLAPTIPDSTHEAEVAAVAQADVAYDLIHFERLVHDHNPALRPVVCKLWSNLNFAAGCSDLTSTHSSMMRSKRKGCTSLIHLRRIGIAITYRSPIQLFKLPHRNRSGFPMMRTLQWLA